MKIREVISCSLLVVAISCGQSAPSPYMTDFSNSDVQATFPAYVTLMMPGNPGVAAEETAHMIQYFNDQSPKHLVVIGKSPVDVDARVQAMALQEKNLRIIQIDLKRFYSEVKSAKNLILQNTLKDNSVGNAVFYIRDDKDSLVDWKLFDSYRVIIAAGMHATHFKDQMLLKDGSVEELVSYAEKLAESKGISKDDARKASVWIAKLLPEQSFLASIDEAFARSKKMTGSKDPMMDSLKIMQNRLGNPTLAELNKHQKNLEDLRQNHLAELNKHQKNLEDLRQDHLDWTVVINELIESLAETRDFVNRL